MAAGFAGAVTGKHKPGRWEVLDTEDGRVLAQVDADAEPNRFALAVVEDTQVQDLRLEVRGKPITGQVDQTVGLVWRYRDPDHYYVARLNVLEGNVRLYRVAGGTRVKIAGKENLTLPVRAWYRFGIEQVGDAITVSLDGEVLFRANDAQHAGPGKIGLWTKADSVTWFRDLRLVDLRAR